MSEEMTGGDRPGPSKRNGPVFTVFTPTYNRAETLPRVYRSLKNQTFRDFEWLIVDDGSEDETPGLVVSWEEEAPFPIQFYRQENQGKHVAHNRAVERARGRLFLPFDSDDECVSDALEVLYRHWKQIPPQNRDCFCGVTGLCVDTHGQVVGDEFPEDVLDSDSLEMRYRYRVRGEKWGFQRTDLLRQYRFPEGVAGTFVPEGVVWSAVAREGYLTRFVNERLRIYHVQEEETSDQLSVVLDEQRHAAGLAYWHRSILDEDLPQWWSHAPLEFYLSAARYARFSIHCGRGLGRQFRELDSLAACALWLTAIPLGILMYLVDRLR